MADTLDRNAVIQELARAIAAVASGDDEDARVIITGIATGYAKERQTSLPGLPSPPPALTAELIKKAAVGRLFYLALAPDLFGPVVSSLAKRGMLTSAPGATVGTLSATYAGASGSHSFAISCHRAPASIIVRSRSLPKSKSMAGMRSTNS